MRNAAQCPSTSFDGVVWCAQNTRRTACTTQTQASTRRILRYVTPCFGRWRKFVKEAKERTVGGQLTAQQRDIVSFSDTWFNQPRSNHKPQLYAANPALLRMHPLATPNETREHGKYARL